MIYSYNNVYFMSNKRLHSLISQQEQWWEIKIMVLVSKGCCDDGKLLFKVWELQKCFDNQQWKVSFLCSSIKSLLPPTPHTLFLPSNHVQYFSRWRRISIPDLFPTLERMIMHFQACSLALYLPLQQSTLQCALI